MEKDFSTSFDTRMANNLQSTQSYLEEKQKTFMKALESISSRDNRLADNCLVQIGAELWCLKSIDEAKEFYHRQINHSSQSLEQVSNEIEKQRNSSDNSQPAIFTPRENENHEEPDDLPIIEIFEQLDSFGNVVEVKLNDVPFQTSSKEITQAQHSLPPNPKNDAVFPAEKQEFSENVYDEDEKVDAQISELFHDMEIISPHNGKDQKLLDDRSEQAKDNLDTSSVKQPSDLYELELIAGSFHEHDEDFEDFDDFDYEFEDSDEDSDEYSDCETLEGTPRTNFMSEMDTSLLPGNSTASSRLRDEIIALRRSKSDQESNQNERRVRFKDTLDIKEIENVSQELKGIEHRSQKVSRFKEAKSLQTKSPSISKSIFDFPSTPDEKSSEVISDIQERSPQDIPQSELDWPKSPIPMTVKNKNLGKSISSSSETANAFHMDLLSGTQRTTNEITRSSTSSTDSSSLVSSSTEHDTNDIGMDDMMAAYNRGDYDNDVCVSGPIVSKLDDFAKLNKLINSMNTEVTKPSPHSRSTHENSVSENEFDTMNQVGSFTPDSSDDEIMTDSIIEHEFENVGNPTEMEEINDIERIKQDIIEREVSEQYHRLRQKIHSQNDPSFEEKDEQKSGRVSRFKSKRTQT